MKCEHCGEKLLGVLVHITSCYSAGVFDNKVYTNRSNEIWSEPPIFYCINCNEEIKVLAENVIDCALSDY